MCWSKYERFLEEQEEKRREDEELRRLEAEAEQRAAQLVIEAKEKDAREPVRV
jgi:hypothetical protein